MFFPAAKVIIRHPSDSNKILLVKRTIGKQISYEPAGGRININFQEKKAESLEECALREVREELGLIVKLERYIGSYYFFWSFDATKGCSCALFVGTIVEEDKNFTGNPDTEEFPVEPAWVTRDEVINKKIFIEESHYGLENLVRRSFEE